MSVIQCTCIAEWVEVGKSNTRTEWHIAHICYIAPACACYSPTGVVEPCNDAVILLFHVGLQQLRQLYGPYVHATTSSVRIGNAAAWEERLVEAARAGARARRRRSQIGEPVVG